MRFKQRTGASLSTVFYCSDSQRPTSEPFDKHPPEMMPVQLSDHAFLLLTRFRSNLTQKKCWFWEWKPSERVSRSVRASNSRVSIMLPRAVNKTSMMWKLPTNNFLSLTSQRFQNSLPFFPNFPHLRIKFTKTSTFLINALLLNF